MKIEMNEGASQATIWTTLIIAMFLCIGHGCKQTEDSFREAIKAGLVEADRTGSTGKKWVKPE